MAYKLFVEKYGKIEKAEIEVAPLTLFIGDNNSGKSFLLSLLWAFSSGEINQIIDKDIETFINEEYIRLKNSILEWFCSENRYWADEVLEINVHDIVSLINDLLEKNKNSIVRSLFNYEGMSIGQLKVQLIESGTFKLRCANRSLKMVGVNVGYGLQRRGFLTHRDRENVTEDMEFCDFIVVHTVEMMLRMFLTGESGRNSALYLPAARTGFMLARNTINQVGRKRTFDTFFENDDVFREEEISPFPKSIIRFLDAMESLDYVRGKSLFPQLVQWVTENMTNGDVLCIDENSGNLQYVPRGKKKGIPLRASSGVVTELSPLLLFLKHSTILKNIYYEEPEMCLHPKLQINMAKLLIRMVNSGINIIATTHSDILIQHINNMCQLNAAYSEEVCLDDFALDEADLVDINNVAVYQYDDNGDYASVKRLVPEHNIFKAETFVNALSNILEQTLNVSDVVDSKED